MNIDKNNFLNCNECKFEMFYILLRVNWVSAFETVEIVAPPLP